MGPSVGSGAGIALLGQSVSGIGTYGYALTGSGVTGSTFSGIGVTGNQTDGAVASVGVLGTSVIGDGVKGTSGGSWPHAGVYGVNTSSGAGVFGDGGTATGVAGHSTSTGTGVYGEALLGAGYGVFGYNNSTGYGVYGMHNNGGGGSGFGYAGYFSGDVNVTGTLTATTYGPSDERLKKDIKNASYGLSELLKLRPVTYKWKTEEYDTGTQVGLVAQEVRKVIPDVVKELPSNHMLSLNYSALVPVLIKGLQEQNKIIQQQEDRIAALEKARSPLASGGMTAKMGGTLALGLLPLGFVAARRRRNRSGDKA